MSLDPQGLKDNAFMAPLRAYSSLDLGVRILIWMVFGAIVGGVMGPSALIFKPVGDLFIRLLLMAAIPLVFFNLVAGITSLSDIAILGKLGLKTFLYYVTTTAMALTVGLVGAMVFKPGAGMTLKGEVADDFGDVPNVSAIVLDLFPSNIFKSFVDGNIGQVVVFSIFIGIAALLMPKVQKDKVQDLFAVTAELFRKLVTVILYFGPLGVGALAAATVGEYGSAVFGPMAKFVGTVWSAQLLMVGFYFILLTLFTRWNPFVWFRKSTQLYVTTAATCSSLASLVVAMDVAEKKLKLPQSVFSFTLPFGAQLNKDGTSIMLAGVLLFTAQAAGINFTIPELISIILIGLLLSEGSGGIPGGGLVIALIFVEAFNLPVEIAGIVAGIYRLIDMGSTTINVMGDMTWTSILSAQAERNPG